jgi:hypothetical protein
MLRLTDRQRNQISQLQKEVDGKIEAILTADQKNQLKRMQAEGPGVPFGPFGGGPGMGRGGRGGIELDPLVGMEERRAPLRSKVLAAPALRKRYLQNVKAIAEQWFDWKNLGPVVARYRSLIEKEVEADTRKLDSFEEFKELTAEKAEPMEPGARRGPPRLSLRAFAEQRRNFLLNHPEVKKATEVERN